MTVTYSTVPFYPMADALMLELHEKANGLLVGHRQELLDLGGGLTFKTDVMIESEVREDHVGSAMMKLRKSVWAYLVYIGKERHLYLMLFDGPAAGMKTTDFQKGMTGTIVDTWEKVRPHVKAVFRSRSVEGWSSCEIGDLEQGFAVENLASAATSTGEADGKA